MQSILASWLVGLLCLVSACAPQRQDASPSVNDPACRAPIVGSEAGSEAGGMAIVRLRSQALSESGYEGVVALLDGETGTLFASSTDCLETPAVPASTFKVFSSLAALEAGVVISLDQTISLPEYTSSREEINRDLDFQSAFTLSALPHYREIVDRVGAEKMQSYLDAVGYGNRSMQGEPPFWISGELRITPVEQLLFLQRLVTAALPFRSEVIAGVKKLMRRDELDGRLHGKTGWATGADGLETGWAVGWLERPGIEPLFFVTLLQTRMLRPDFIPLRMQLALDALSVYQSGQSGKAGEAARSAQ